MAAAEVLAGVDIVALRLGEAGALQLLLIRRGQAPFEGQWALPGVPGTQWLTQDRSALASGSGLSISAWLGATQAACGLCASLLPRRRLARAASWFSAGAMASPPGTGSSSGHSGVKPFCASTSKLAIFILAFLVALEMATYSI